MSADTYHASGAGGQNVNKTSSAVRMTHFPTGIVVSSQTSRDRVHNRETVWRCVQSLLKCASVSARKKMADIKGEMKKIEWGCGFTYVFHPYSRVKDHRTGYEIVTWTQSWTASLTVSSPHICKMQ